MSRIARHLLRIARELEGTSSALIAETAVDHDALEALDPRLGINLANFMGDLALPEEVEHWSLMKLREKQVKLSEHGHGSNACAITVPSGLILEKYVEGSMVPRPGRWFAVARTGNAEVKLVAGSNVAIHHPNQVGGELVIPQWATAICFYTRMDATNARVSVTGF